MKSNNFQQNRNNMTNSEIKNPRNFVPTKSASMTKPRNFNPTKINDYTVFISYSFQDKNFQRPKMLKFEQKSNFKEQ